jgi:uncharacterized protein
MIQTSELIIATVFVVAVFLVYLSSFWILFQWFYKKVRPSNKLWLWFQRGIVFSAFIGIICIFYGYVVEPGRITTTYLELKSGKILHNQKIRLVHISDLHIEDEGKHELVIPEIIRKENPDLIVLTGDYLNSDEAQPVLKRLLGKLQAPYGVYAITGNFDYINTIGPVFKETNVRILLNESVSLNIGNSKLSLSSDNFSIPKSQPDAYRIFLYHSPDLIPEAGKSGFDLYLCGHTHGGQVRLPFYGALITFSKYGKRYERGYYREDNMDVYVNSGIGLEPGVLYSARFLCPPEITIITVTGE